MATPKPKTLRLAALLLMLAELFVVQLMFLQPQLAYAQNSDVSGSTPIPGANGFSAQQSIHDLLCTPNANSSGQDLYVCINRIIRFVIVLAASLSVLMLVWAGYDYMFGGEESVQQAKGILVGVVAGLMIILISFIFLNQINPDLLKIKTIQPPEFTASKLPTCADLAKQFPKANINPTNCAEDFPGGNISGTSGPIPNHAETSCGKGPQYCQKFSSAGISCDVPDNVCQGQVGLVARLSAVWSITKGKLPAWHVGSSFPPKRGSHDSSCHNETGSCVDINFDNASDRTAANYATLCRAVKQANLGVLNEAKPTSGNAAAESTSACGKFTLTDKSTGDHLHVYLP